MSRRVSALKAAVFFFVCGFFYLATYLAHGTDLYALGSELGLLGVGKEASRAFGSTTGQKQVAFPVSR